MWGLPPRRPPALLALALLGFAAAADGHGLPTGHVPSGGLPPVKGLPGGNIPPGGLPPVKRLPGGYIPPGGLPPINNRSGNSPDWGADARAGAVPAIDPYDEECWGWGGQCMPAGQCPLGDVNPLRHRCASQRQLGAECCVPVHERPCALQGQTFLGLCRPPANCGIAPPPLPTPECGDEFVCCVLVRRKGLH